MPVRKTIIVSLVLAVLLVPTSSTAQQIPYLNELFRRFELFNRLQQEKRPAGSQLSALESLRRRGEEAFKRGNIPELLETESEALALIQGTPWDERQRFIASLALETNRLVIEPNTDLEVSLVRMFPSDTSSAFRSIPTVTFEVVEAGGKRQAPGANPQPARLSKPLSIGDRVAVGEAISSASRRLLLSDGQYSVVARIESGGEKLVELKTPLYAISNFSDTIAQLSKTIAQIKSSTDPKVKSMSDFVATPAFQLERLAGLTKSRGEDDIDPVKELDRIENALSQLSKGNNPFSDERGELERAYVASDGKLVPYRLYVPRSYDGASPRPLVLLLHGALGDEHYYFSGLFDPSVVKGEAERRGWILAGVNGRGRFGGYRGPGLEDSFEVTKAVERDYKVDSSRIFLTGHSMGGYGAWLVASARPDLFAAMAPVSGGAPFQGDALAALLGKIKSMPVMIVHGARDGIVAPQQSQAIYAAAKEAGLTVTYFESPDTDHIGVLAATFPSILDFFEKHPKLQPVK